MVWTPRLTVAAIIERQGKLLFVREHADDRIVINQPAGHLEDNETLSEAVRREVLEESGWLFNPQYLIGIYQLRLPEKDRTYIRFCFAGDLVEKTDCQLDKDIIETIWLNDDELAAMTDQCRSPLVQKCVQDYRQNQRYPLSLLIEPN